MSINNGRITDRGWEFSDKATFHVVDVNKDSLEKVRDDYPGAFKPQAGGTPHPTGLGTIANPQEPDESVTPSSGRGLVIRLAATHAGLVTRNNGFYLPDKMRDGVKTFTDLYPKPIQVHHEDHTDPVGRVLAARYVETVSAVADRFKNSILRDSRNKDVGRADLEFWKDFCGSDKSFIEKLQMIKLMDNVLSDKHYRGVGYIELTADITDPDAIQKVLDGRFLTGSVGAVSDKAVCSICNTNWLEEEYCDHRPGRVYDGKKCFVIAGGLEYDEYSFVNTPADRHSTILSIESNNFRDSVKDDKKPNLFFYPIADYFHEEDSAMDKNPTATESEVEVKDEAQASDETATGSTKTVATPDAEAGANADVKDAAEASAESGEKTDETIKDKSTEEKVEDAAQDDPVLVLLDKVFSGEEVSLTDADSDVLYDALVAEFPEEFKDAALSANQRKKLPKSSFCGPGRSFPVLDCAHVTAARRLASRYKGPGSKKAIMDRIDRKAKALGCNSEDGVCNVPVKDSTGPQEKVEDGRLTGDVVRSILAALDLGLYGSSWDETETEAPVLTSKEIESLRMMVVELVKRIGKDNLEGALVAEGLITNKEDLDAQVAEATRLEDELGNKNTQLNALRQELRATYADVANLTDQLVDANAKIRDQKVRRAGDLYKLDGSFTDELTDKLIKLSDEVLDNTLETLSSKVDITKIAAKVNDGLSRTPEETVDNPTEVTTPSVTEENKDTVDSKPTFHTQDQVDREYRRILVKMQNPVAAKAFYEDAVAKGLAAPKPGFDN